MVVGFCGVSCSGYWSGHGLHAGQGMARGPAWLGREYSWKFDSSTGSSSSSRRSHNRWLGLCLIATAQHVGAVAAGRVGGGILQC